MEEDAIQDMFGDKLHTAQEEVPKEELIPNNDLRESFVTDVQ